MSSNLIDSNLSNAIQIGIGLRHPHYQEILETDVDIDFLEVHSENFYAPGGATNQFLVDVASRYPMSLHGTSMGLGSSQNIPSHALNSLKRLTERITPKFVSDHACFSWGLLTQHTSKDILVNAGDLLPIIFDDASLKVFIENVDAVQEKLKRPILLENLSAYLLPGQDTMSETEFLNALCDRAGCGLILDVNNIVVNARNNKQSLINQPAEYISQINPSHVQEIHLAGCTQVPDTEIMVDDHSSPVANEVWSAYRLAIHKMGAKPTLVEWDTNVPELEILLGEAHKAREIAKDVLQKKHQTLHVERAQ